MKRKAALQKKNQFNYNTFKKPTIWTFQFFLLDSSILDFSHVNKVFNKQHPNQLLQQPFRGHSFLPTQPLHYNLSD